MKAAEVMVREVISVEVDATIEAAVALMLRENISGLPVVDRDGRLAGIVTEGDFLRRSETGTERHRPRWLEFLIGPGRLADEYVRSHGRRVEEVMTRNVVTVTEDTPLDDIVELMEQKHIKRVPVVRGSALVGIVTRADLVRAFAGLAPQSASESATDAEIRARLLADLRRQPWSPVASINPVVHDGVVELWGVILDERERQALRVAAENVQGVKAVHDHLVWVEPYSGYVIDAPAAAEGEASRRRRGKRERVAGRQVN